MRSLIAYKPLRLVHTGSVYGSARFCVFGFTEIALELLKYTSLIDLSTGDPCPSYLSAAMYQTCSLLFVAIIRDGFHSREAH